MKRKQPSKLQEVNEDVPDLLLAETYDEDKHKIDNWFVLEKLDGLRCYWNGKDGIWSRLKHRLYAPKWFIKYLPQGIPLDGELFVGRGKFQQTVSFVRKHQGVKEEWKQIKFHFFDILTLESKELKFTQRLELMKLIPNNNYLIMVQQDVCPNTEKLQELFRDIIEQKGEGLMLRNPRSVYKHKRSKNLLKLKPFFDAEAIVVEHEMGKGRNSDRLGAYLCTMPNGKKFKIGSGLSDQDRDHPIKIGTVITYKYNELTQSGVPRFPTFLRAFTH
jgi:DNA ligase 1